MIYYRCFEGVGDAHEFPKERYNTMNTTTNKEMLIDALVNAWEKAHALEKAMAAAKGDVILDPEEWKNTRNSVGKAAYALSEAYDFMERVVDDIEKPLEGPDFKKTYSKFGPAYAAMIDYVEQYGGASYAISTEFDEEEFDSFANA